MHIHTNLLHPGQEEDRLCFLVLPQETERSPFPQAIAIPQCSAPTHTAL